jgi:predicted O-methyltransferase YrrM
MSAAEPEEPPLQLGEDEVGAPPTGAAGALAGRLSRAVAEVEQSAVALAALTALATVAATRPLPLGRRVTLGLAAAGAVGSHVRAAGRLAREVRSATDAASLTAVLGGAAPLFGRWAVEADFAGIVAREVEQAPGLVVECGSGATTLIIAAMLRRSGRGRLVSIEHDEAYAERTTRALEAAGLLDVVELVVAPLRDRQVAGRTVRWYDAERVTQAIDADIDLLVVDGPPQRTRWSRWPALAVLHPRLAPHATVLVDDGRTRAALATTRAWTDAFPDLERYWLDSVKGTWLLRRRPDDRSDGRSLGTLLKVAGALQPRPSGSGLWPVRR